MERAPGTRTTVSIILSIRMVLYVAKTEPGPLDAEKSAS